jgi:hypothetical protein
MYILLADLSLRFDNIYSFGTSGTCFASIGFGTTQIGRASEMIDSKLDNLYGTASPIFGTNGWGTSDVPELVKSACADIALGLCFQNKELSRTDREMKWGDKIYQRGLDLLDYMTDPTVDLKPFNGTKLPIGIDTPGAYEQVRGEVISFNGTNLFRLKYANVIKDSLKIYGTDTTNPAQYKEGIDFTAFYWNQDNTGTRAGNIAGTGTTGIFTALVDYKYRKDNIFNLNDNYKWGFPYKERRG